jgi:hypothetical protein
MIESDMYFDSRKACIECFKDRVLREEISERNQLGDCDWCGANNVYVVPIYEFSEWFRDVVSIYEPVGLRGDPIGFLLQDDWEIFSDKIEDLELMQDLTLAILTADLKPKEVFDYPEFDQGFRTKEPELVEHWHSLAEAHITGEVPFPEKTRQLYGSRHIEDQLPDQLEVVFEDLSRSIEEGENYYRARIHKDRYRYKRFSLNEMGAPPPERAENYRANRKGEPVLYLANDDKTALCEIRAWKGAAVAIVKMEVQNQIRLVSLLQKVEIESPFFDEILEWRVGLAELFHRLTWELSLPVMPHEEKDLYRSTQYLCDWIKKYGYGGVEFPSAMGPGHNLVLFDINAVSPTELKYVRVNETDFSYDELGDYEELYEEHPYEYLFKK